jgi:6-phosphogluconolactonase
MNEEEYYTLAVGTYTKKEGHVDGKAKGIYIIKQNKNTGALSIIDTIEGPVNPSYLAIHPTNNSIYAVNEIASNTEKNIGTISSYHLNQSENKYKLINSVLSQGDAPCHISFDPSNQYVLVANYMGTISAMPIAEDHGLGASSDIHTHESEGYLSPRQDSPHPHMIMIAPDGESILVADLGMNAILHYSFQSGKLNKLTSTAMEPLAGPRHMATNNQSQVVYVLNELSNTIEVLSWTNADSPMERVQTISTLPENTEKIEINSSAIHMHPNGQYLYAANRSSASIEDNTIAAFKIDSATGKLALIQIEKTNGDTPRDFAIAPDGKYMLIAHQNSDNIKSFEILEDGTIRNTGQSMDIFTPVCLKYFP